MTFLGIALPSLLLVLALRRWLTPVPWRVAALFFALTLVFLHGAVFTSKLPVPVDEVAQGYPWRGVVGPVTPRNPLTNDTVKLFLPWMQVAREELFHLRAPLWNRYSFGGYPLLGNGESAPFSPLFLATLFVPLPKQIVAMAGLKIFVALLFTYLFVKREGAGDAAAIFAAIAFAWSVFMSVFLYYSTASVMAFLPAAAYAVVRRSAVFMALVVATLMANGHPESVFHIAIGCVAVLLCDWVAELLGDWVAGPSNQATKQPRYSINPSNSIIGALLGLALSAPAWVPVLEQIPLSARYAAMRQGESFGRLPVTALWALMMPNGFGNPVRHNWSWIGQYAGVAVSYAGLLPLALFAAAFVAPKTSRRDRALGVVAIALFVMAMDWTPLSRLPPLSLVANDKLRCVAIFFAIVVAAKALDVSRRLFAAFAIPIGILSVYAFRAHPTLMRPVDLIGMATLIAFFVLPSRAAPALVAIELFVLNAGFNALVDQKYFRPRLPIVEALRARAPAEPYRVAGLDWTLIPNASAQYGLEDIRGSDPMAFASYDRYLQRFTVQEPGTWVRRVVDPTAAELDFLNVRYLMTDPGAAPGGRWREVYRGPDGGLFENMSVRPRFWPVEQLREVAPGEFTMRVSLPAGGTVYSSEVAAPGRRVVVNGRSVPIRIVDGTFMSFQVPAGNSLVRLEYRPMSYRVSIVAMIVAAVVLAGAALRGLSRSERP